MLKSSITLIGLFFELVWSDFYKWTATVNHIRSGILLQVLLTLMFNFNVIKALYVGPENTRSGYQYLSQFLVSVSLSTSLPYM